GTSSCECERSPLTPPAAVRSSNDWSKIIPAWWHTPRTATAFRFCVGWHLIRPGERRGHVIPFVIPPSATGPDWSPLAGRPNRPELPGPHTAGADRQFAAVL